MNYTINEIARLVGVTKSTVSKAMNGQKGVSEKKRAQIMRLASKMNYIPNAAARALSHNMSDTIGVIISADTEYTLQNLYWLEFIVAVSEEAERHNCNLLIIAQGKDNFKPLENAVRKRAVDGLVIPAELAYPDAIQFIKESKMPFVLQGQSSLFGHYCVDVRNKEGAEILTSRLVESGYKKIACIAGPDEFRYNEERVEGFKSVMAKNGVDLPPTVNSGYMEEETRKNVRSLVKRIPDLDALFITAGGDFAFYIFDALRDAGFDLEKIGFAIFDYNQLFRHLPYKIISARQPVREMGLQDAKILFELINKENPPKTSLFDITLVE